MEVKLISGNAKLHKETPQMTVLDFGTLKQNSPVKATVKIEGVTTSNLQPTCRCSVVKSDEKNIFNLEYVDNHLLIPFGKTFTLTYSDMGKNFTSYIKIKGNIIK